MEAEACGGQGRAADPGFSERPPHIWGPSVHDLDRGRVSGNARVAPASWRRGVAGKPVFSRLAIRMAVLAAV